MLAVSRLAKTVRELTQSLDRFWDNDLAGGCLLSKKATAEVRFSDLLSYVEIYGFV